MSRAGRRAGVGRADRRGMGQKRGVGRARLAAALFGAALLSGVARAQDGSAVDDGELAAQGLDDVPGLGVNQRLFRVDQRQRFGFDSVRALGGRDPGTDVRDPGDATTGDGRLFARFQGDVAAVFPGSTYARTKKGSVATIPPGTVFYIGGVPEDVAARLRGESAARPAPAFNAVVTLAGRDARGGYSTRAGGLVHTRAMGATGTGGTGGEGSSGDVDAAALWTDADARAARIARRLAEAAQGDATAGGVGDDDDGER